MFNFKKTKKYKEQRDRFLAYAFASADLFIEISPNGKITFATGAVKSLTGIDPETLMGKKWLTIFEPKFHNLLIDLKKKARPGIRQGPFLVDLSYDGMEKAAILTSVKIPQSKNFYLTLGISNILLSELARLMEEQDAGPMLTGFIPDGLTEEEPLETGFKAEDEIDQVLQTGLEPEDLKTDDPFTTDFKADEDYLEDDLPDDFHDVKDEALTTGYQAEDIKEAETLTTGFDAGDIEEDKALTTGYVAEDLDKSAMTTGFQAENEDQDVLTTGYQGNDAGLGDTMEERAEFYSEARRVFNYAKRTNLSASMTVFEFERTETIPEEDWPEIILKISEVMRAHSLVGSPPAHIKDDVYALIHDSDKELEKLKTHINKAIKELTPNGETINIETRTIDASLTEMSTDDATRALLHTINAIKEGNEEEIEFSLIKNMKKLVTTNDDKLAEFKSIIDRVDFQINFQPIVKTDNGEAEYYEVLCRVASGDIADWVLFGEDHGLSPKFDLAVLERTMNYIHFKAGTTRTRFAVNISSKSIENDDFFEQFHDQLSRRDLSNRMLIEINNPQSIENAARLRKFVESLDDLDYAVSLDHIDLNDELAKMLEDLNVEYIKTNSKHLERLYNAPDKQELVKTVLKTCSKKNIKIVGQFVEEKEQINFLKQIKVECAQGYLFGPAEPAPKFIPPTR